MQICTENFFSMVGEGTPLPESLKFLDILGENLVIFYKFSRFISEKIHSFYQKIFQLMCEKKNKFLSFTLFRGGGLDQKCEISHFFLFLSENFPKSMYSKL